jgi:hypothetical protein
LYRYIKVQATHIGFFHDEDDAARWGSVYKLNAVEPIA